MTNTRIALTIWLASIALIGAGVGLANLSIWLFGNTVWAIAAVIGVIFVAMLIGAAVADLRAAKRNTPTRKPVQ